MSGMDGRTKESELSDLCASEIACAVADAWVQHPTSWDLGHKIGISRKFVAALDRLEAVTRQSPLRTVKP